MTSLRARYLAGEHRAVYDALVADPAHAEADAIAEEMMNRVRANAITLANRWKARGMTLTNPGGKRGEQSAHVGRLEAAFGPLPATLRAFYDVVGHLNFVCTPPGDPWPGEEELDALMVMRLDEQIQDVLEAEEPELALFPDPLTKMDISGVGAIYVSLPATGFDAQMMFEGDALPDRFVPYLRTAILERGGVSCMLEDMPDRELVAELTRDLIAF